MTSAFRPASFWHTYDTYQAIKAKHLCPSCKPSAYILCIQIKFILACFTCQCTTCDSKIVLSLIIEDICNSCDCEVNVCCYYLVFKWVQVCPKIIAIYSTCIINATWNLIISDICTFSPRVCGSH